MLMRNVGLICCLCIFSLVGKSQDVQSNKFKVGIGGVLAIPANNLNESSIGGGFDVLALYDVSDKISLSGDAGFTALAGKGIFTSTAIIPVRVGLRYLPGSNFYLGAKGGIGIFTILKESVTYLGYSFGAGYQLSPRFDLGVSYDGYSKKDISFGLVALRLGYSFGK
jgi:hypothetical protein